MGNCCSGTPTVASSLSPLSVVAENVTPARPDALAPSPRPRSRTTSMHEPMPHSGVSSQGSNPRSRAKSAPQRPRVKSSVLQNVITRPQPVTGPSRNRFDLRTSDPEQPNVGANASTVSHLIRNPTPSTVKQIRELQISRGKTIRATIKAGRNRYWRNLWSNIYFINEPLESCVDVIHAGIVEIWNLNDVNRHLSDLSSDQFKINMSHVVKDLAVPARDAPWRPSRFISRDKVADWVYISYEGRQTVVRCLMGYIVDLHVILDDITKAAIRTVTDNDALEVMDEHIRSGRRDSIHREIRDFVTETYPTRFAIANPPKDQVLEKIIELIRQYCDLPNEYI